MERRTGFSRRTPLRVKGHSETSEVKPGKLREWKTVTADTHFSLFIRGRDGRCQYPGCYRTEGLDCSHFFERHHSGTRFDPLNCIALCRDHHTEWERQKKYEYKEFMVNRIGAEAYAAMERRAWTYKNRGEAVQECMAALQ